MDVNGHIKRLVHLRDKYSDEVPSRIVRSSDFGFTLRYKVQQNWWLRFVIHLDMVKEHVSEKLRRKIGRFMRWSTRERPRRLTTAKDIQKANGIINEIIAELLGQAS